VSGQAGNPWMRKKKKKKKDKKLAWVKQHDAKVD
jgi:hypothetical protein